MVPVEHCFKVQHWQIISSVRVKDLYRIIDVVELGQACDLAQVE